MIPETEKLQHDEAGNRKWLKLTIMVENTEENRAVAVRRMWDLRALAEKFQGDKIVKGEAIQVFGRMETNINKL